MPIPPGVTAGFQGCGRAPVCRDRPIRSTAQQTCVLGRVGLVDLERPGERSRAASIAAARIAEGSSRPARTVRTASSESSTVLSPRLPLPRVIIASRPMAIRSGISDQEISVRPIVCFATAMRADAVIVPNDEDEACWIAFAEARKGRPTSAGKLSRISATACQPEETVIPRSPSPSLPSWLLSSSVVDLTPSAILHAALLQIGDSECSRRHYRTVQKAQWQGAFKSRSDSPSSRASVIVAPVISIDVA